MSGELTRVNKAKLRREKKQVLPSQQQPQAPEQERKMKTWVIRLIMLIPPILYACYLVWDMYQQQ
jgi:hypothetical protein